jgi:hypothetical protein
VSFCARLLEHDRLEIVTLAPVVLDILECFTELCFEPADAVRCLSLLLFSSSAESGRRACIALSLFVGDFGGGLHFYGNLDVVALLALDGHDLDAALAGRAHGHASALALHGNRVLVAGVLHGRIVGGRWVGRVSMPLILARGYRSRLAVG